MSKWNDAISVTFNDNDGGVGWRINPESAKDVERYMKIFGVWRTRWILFKKFRAGLKCMEEDFVKSKPKKLWVFRAEIPE